MASDVTTIKILSLVLLLFVMAEQPTVGQCLLIFKASRSKTHTHTPHTHTHTNTHTRTTAGRTSLDVCSARCGDLYLTTHNTHNIQTSTSPVGFEPAIPARERPETHALDSTATGIGTYVAWIRSDLPVRNTVCTILNHRALASIIPGRERFSWN